MCENSSYDFLTQFLNASAWVNSSFVKDESSYCAANLNANNAGKTQAISVAVDKSTKVSCIYLLKLSGILSLMVSALFRENTNAFWSFPVANTLV